MDEDKRLLISVAPRDGSLCAHESHVGVAPDTSPLADAMGSMRVQCSAAHASRDAGSVNLVLTVVSQLTLSARGIVSAWLVVPGGGGDGGGTSTPLVGLDRASSGPQGATEGGRSYLDFLRVARAGPPRGRPGRWMPHAVVLSTYSCGSETESETNSFVGGDTRTNDSSTCV
jgi:hypothetical protein